MRRFALAFFLLLSFGSLITPHLSQAQAPTLCADVRTLMQRDLTPYDLTLEGGALSPDQTQTLDFGPDVYAQFWSLNVVSFTDENGRSQRPPLQLRFDQTDDALEFAVYQGMVALHPWSPLGALELPLSEDAIYTIVIRRRDLSTLDQTLTAEITATFSGDNNITLENLRDETLSAPLPEAPEFEDGQQVIALPSAAIRLHPAAAAGVASRNSQAAQVRFENGGSLLIGAWADTITALAGDLVVRGPDRVFFLQDFGYRRDLLADALASLEDANRNRLVTDWDAIQGIWMLRDCLGVKLSDGRTLIAPLIADQPRNVTLQGGLTTFNAEFEPYSLALDWTNIAPDSEITISNGVLTALLTDDRTLTLESNEIQWLWRESILDITLEDRDATLTLDWLDLSGLTLTLSTLTLDFTDSPRGQVTRSGADLLRFESLDGVTQILYKPVGSGANAIRGEQRLLLPASDSYLEIVTPAGDPAFDRVALPDQAGFSPRGLNNLGGQCYPVNTVLPAANCPPNGEINPSNGNLWYAITDLSAHGALIDLDLTRSYNRLASAIDGPFGLGWTSAFLLDYRVAFDEQIGSRLITPETFTQAPVSLDLTYAPRGLITWYTPTGSRHVFVSDDDPNTFSAITLPGWTLTRTDLRSPWTLRQSDGYITEFDRGGRILRYGYPDRGRMVEITYPRDLLNGVIDLGGEPVVISDAAEQRQLALYFNGQARVERAVLRDVSATESDCTPENGCFEIAYRYDENGRLIGVDYGQGREARYDYDNTGRLSQHDDPRAPIAPRMSYTEVNNSLQIAILDDDQVIPWRTLSPPEISNRERRATLTDEWGNPRTYSYALENTPNLRAAGNHFTLIQLAEPDSVNQTFTWQNGLLTQINARLGPNGQGRNSTAIRYNNGVIQGISGGFLEIALDYTAEGRLTQARFADDTTIQVTYTENGLPQTYTDRQGAVYDLTYDENGFIAQRFRQNDRQLTVYTYNALGLVTSVNLDGHTITYTWDPLGRLIAIEDPILGTHTIRYQTDLISVIDASGVEQITQFDPLGRVNERRLQTEADPALRRVTYTYDVFDRLLSESEWISEEVAYTTRYEYLPMRELPAQPGDLVTTIHGYNVNVTDPYGRVTAYAYDREGRIRQIVDPLRKVTRMDYFTTETGNYTNGLRVVQREILASQVVTLTTYLFDLRYQLREVIQDKGDDRIRWIFNTGGDPVTINLLEATAADLRTVTWSDYRGARPTTIEVLPVPLTLNSGQRQPNLELSITSDFLGRPITRTDANGVTVQTAYCPRPNGALETRISQPNQVEPFGCDDGAIFAQATLTDIHGRLLSENTSDRGDQTYRTERDGQDWRITVSFGADQWALRYNPAGDLIEWVDESGHLHQYEYDRRGRLLRVTVPDQPEASLSFEYNAADLVTRQVDDLGRGTLYQYDPRGLLLVNQDLLTADATTYAYGAFGQMTSAISPLGASFTYRYDDPTDPLRLTGVIDPNGGAQTFTWNEVDNTLTYSDVRGNQTRYSFDAFGLLWRIDDAAGQSHELRYNANGDLSAIVTAQPNGRAAARNLTLTHEADGTLVITEPSVTDWSWRFRFDTQGDLIRITDPNRYELGITYDPLGRITGINGDEPYSWQIEYQPGESALLFNGTRLEYDSLMRLTRIVTADETETTYTYGVEDGAVTLDLDGANTRRYTFTTGDNASEPRTVTLTAPGHTVTYRYNPEGLIEEFRSEACTAADLSACETDQTLLWITAVTFAYDSQGRPVRIVDAEQNIETFVYDDVGNLIAYQTPNSKTYTYGYDRLGRLTALSSPTGIKLLLSYDPLDNVTGICRTRVEAPDDYTGCERAGGVIERYTYDPLGRLTAQTFPNSGSSTGQTTITHTYSAGWLTSWGTPERTITRVYEQNIFGLLERLDQSYRFSYDPMRRIISETGETYAYSYAYDPFGRVIQLDQDTPITYQPDGRGYTVADLAHTLNEAGFLSALRYGLSEDLPGMAINYILTARDPNVLSVVLSADDGTRGLDAQFDRRGVPLSAFFTYGDHRLLIDYVTNPNGAIARQRITGRPAVPFEQGAGGYIMVTGYDDDERPTTLRITDNASGALLYTVSFTYNGVGQRETENRRYADGAQVNIRYEYGETAQLTRQLIEVIPVTQAISLLFLAPLLFWLRQRRGRFALLILLVGGVLWFATITAQTNSLTLEYRYDSVGNLSQVVSASGVCREYRYDALGRVTAISGEQVFVYDATGRLIGQNGNQIRYTGDHPYQIETDGRPSAPGRIAGMPPLWTATEGAGVIWNITDMRAQILTTEVSETPLRLYDPLGRRIQFTLPAFADDPCVLHGFEGLTFTPTGRAYDPTIGLYLQRGPIDVFGGAYTAQGQRDLPIQTSEGLQLARGLQVLGQAYQTTRLSQNLDASVIRARYLPQAPKTDLWIEDLGGDSAIRDSLETLLTLPYWLNTEFNLAGGAIDPQSGAITLGNESQLGVASRAIHETPIARLLQFTETGIALPISYQPLTGTMHNPLARTWQPITPQFAFFDRVLMRLPRPLIAPEQALTTLNAVEKVIDLANQTGGDWADQLLEGALPIRPETILPPLNAETWRSKWFSTDTFGLGTVLGERLEVPNQPHLPLYRLAWNEDWLFPSSR